MVSRTTPSPKLAEEPSASDELVGGEANDAARPRLLAVEIVMP